MAPKHRARGAARASATCGAFGRGCRGRGARTPRASRGHRGHGGSSRGLPTEAADEGALAHDFVLYVHGLISCQIALPFSFAPVVSKLGLEGLWLRAQGYPYNPLWVEVRIKGSALVFLEVGWRTFACQFNLRRGDNLCYRFGREETLSVRAFDAYGNQLEPCWESSSDDGSRGADDTRSSALGGDSSGRSITSSRSLNSPSEGSESYSSFEEDAEGIKPTIKQARW